MFGRFQNHVVLRVDGISRRFTTENWPLTLSERLARTMRRYGTTRVGTLDWAICSVPRLTASAKIWNSCGWLLTKTIS